MTNCMDEPVNDGHLNEMLPPDRDRISEGLDKEKGHPDWMSLNLFWNTSALQSL